MYEEILEMSSICSEQTISSKLTKTDTPNPTARHRPAAGISGIMTTPRTFGQQNNPAVTDVEREAGREDRYNRMRSQAVASVAATHFLKTERKLYFPFCYLSLVVIVIYYLQCRDRVRRGGSADCTVS